MAPSFEPRIETVYFDAENYQLKGELHLPPDPDPPMVIGAHGFLANRHSPKLLALADLCNRCGIGFFRFDHRGCGESEGSFDSGTSLQARCNDLLGAIRTLQRMGHAKSGIGFFGSSMGGATVLAAAGQIPVTAIVSYAAPIRYISHPDIPPGTAETHRQQNSGIRFDAQFNFSAIHHLLIFHGDRDTVVPIDHGRDLYQLANRPKRMITQKGGDHPMSLPTHQRAFVRESVYWFKRCFAETRASSPSDSESPL
jgi:dipeptidyl aminopeptidase/acylaminoacyl peptidase